MTHILWIKNKIQGNSGILEFFKEIYSQLLIKAYFVYILKSQRN